MGLDPSLIGRETRPEMATIAAEDISAFADAIGDPSAVFRDEAAARAAGYAHIPAPPTYITRFRVPFAEAGLDVEHAQVLHGEQEYTYERPLYVGDGVKVWHKIASLRQAGRGGMAVMTLEQYCDTHAGERIATGKAVVIVRETPAELTATTSAGSGVRRTERAGPALGPLTKHVTQRQIDAYAVVSRDFNPIHVDPAAARAVGLDGTIAHGMLAMAFLGQVTTDWLATDAPGGHLARLRVRFQAMVRPGDTLTCSGTLAAREGDRQRCELRAENQRGERVVSGDAEVRWD